MAKSSRRTRSSQGEESDEVIPSKQLKNKQPSDQPSDTEVTSDSQGLVRKKASASKKRFGRGGAESEATTKKKAKASMEEEEDRDLEQEPKPKPKVFQAVPGQSLFTPEDVELLMKALAEREAGVKFDTVSETLLKDALSDEFTKEQVSEKMKKLKGKRNGKGMASSSSSSFESGDLLSSIVDFEGFKIPGVSETFLKQGLGMIDERRLAKMNARWADLELAAWDIFTKKSEFLTDLCNLIKEAFNKSGNE